MFFDDLQGTEPSPAELARIEHVAHKAYGWMLSDRELQTIWRMCHVNPHYKPPRPRGVPQSYHDVYVTALRQIAQGHLQIWSAA